MISNLSKALMDKSIFFSFDRSGFLRHAKEFVPLDRGTSLENKSYLIIGATSGIGQSLAMSLARQKAHVWILGREESRTLRTLEQLRALFPGGNHGAVIADLESGAKLRAEFSRREFPCFEGIVLGAGGMYSDYEVTEQGIEKTFVTQVLNHALILHFLDQRQIFSPKGQIIWVSSGGMLLQKLDLSLVRNEDSHSDLSAYANAKRAQVVLAKMMAERFPKRFIFSMHPGWVNTKAVRLYMPKFYQFMKKRLRTPQQGADTIEFLLRFYPALRSGSFWFDRKEQDPHPLIYTREKIVQKKELWEMVQETCRLYGR
jgi:dehydrogenase/reductase SDR family member 12